MGGMLTCVHHDVEAVCVRKRQCERERVCV